MNEQQFNQMLKRQNLACRRQRQRQLLAGVADATGRWTHRRQQRSDLLRYAAAACLAIGLIPLGFITTNSNGNLQVATISVFVNNLMVA